MKRKITSRSKALSKAALARLYCPSLKQQTPMATRTDAPQEGLTVTALQR